MLVLITAGCASGARALTDGGSNSARIVNAIVAKQTVLFGEVHDNAALHEQRAQIVARAIAHGAKPAFAFEQFDREHQTALDAARREKTRDADYLITQASPGKSSWNWALYRPLIQLALDNDLPIIAANLSRAGAMKVAQSDFVASGVFSADELRRLRLDQPIAQSLRDVQFKEIQDGHCNLLPAQAIPTMANAQIARDALMASLIQPMQDRGVILFTGNGHARRDVGVGAWLPASTKTFTVGMLESKTPMTETLHSDARFDSILYVDPQPREDPCVALKARFARTK